MTKTITTLYVVALILIGTLGATFAFASEVTGTLSSGTESADSNGGSIDGTVSGGQSNSGGGGATRTGDRNNNNNDDEPTGAVLGESFAQADTPSTLGFPNAGEQPVANTSGGLAFLLVLAAGISSILYLRNARVKRIGE